MLVVVLTSPYLFGSHLVFNVLQNSQDLVQEMAGKVVMDQDPALRGLGLGQTTGGR